MKLKNISVRGVLLDWDGTLLDSFEADARAYAAMFRALGIAWTERDLARHYSPNWHRIYEAARIPRKQWEEADQLWARAYKRENPQLLPGVRDALKKLEENFSLGLVTSGDRRRVREQLRRFKLEKIFETCVCSEDAQHRKPHPAPLRVAIEQMKLHARNCVYVGDAPEDIEMARRARVRAIGVIGPFPTAPQVRAARPNLLINSIEELPNALEKLCKEIFD